MVSILQKPMSFKAIPLNDKNKNGSPLRQPHTYRIRINLIAGELLSSRAHFLFRLIC